MAQTFGASGTLIGAALENVGFHYQSYILDQLTSPLTSSIAQLVYVVGAILAMVTFAVSGKYKMGFWFLLGPGLYLGSILPRTEAEGVDWKFGTEKRNPEMLNAEVTGTLEKNPGAAKPARVATLFAQYDGVVSRVTQEMVRVISSGRATADVSFIMKAELNGFMKSQSVDDPGFSDLVQHGFMRGCHDVIEAGREMRNPQNSDTEQQDWKAKYEARMKYTQVSLTDQAINYLAAFKVVNPSLADEDLVGWQGMVDRAGPGGNAATQTFLSSADSTKVTEWLHQVDSTEVNTGSQEFIKSVEEEKQKLQRENPFTCSQIWNMVYGGLLRYGKRSVNQAVGMARANGITEAQIASDLAKATGVNTTDVSSQSERLDVLYRIAAQYTFRTEMLNSTTSAFIADYAQKTKALGQFIVPGQSDIAYIEQRRIANSLWQEKSAFVNAATSLPYYQGIVLFFLAVLFPFFAILLLMPGKHVGFLLWFMLWMWAKSWDIGFAVCMLIDDLLFQLFSGGGMEMQCGLRAENCNDFSVAIHALREIDPTFQIATYYNIMGIALTAIPTISSYLIIGSLKGGAGLVNAGVESFSKPYETGQRGMYEESEMNSRYRVAIDNIQEANARAVQNILNDRSPYENGPTGFDGLPGPGDEPLRGVTRSVGREIYGMQVADSTLREGMETLSFVSKAWSGWSKSQKDSKSDIGKIQGRMGKYMSSAQSSLQRSLKTIQQHSQKNWQEAMKRDSANISYDQSNSPDNQGISSRTVADGRMQLPVVVQNGWSQEFEYELLRMRQSLEIKAEFAGAALDQVGNLAEDFLPPKAEPIIGGATSLAIGGYLATRGSDGEKEKTAFGSGTGPGGSGVGAASTPLGAVSNPGVGSSPKDNELGSGKSQPEDTSKPYVTPSDVTTNSGKPMANGGSVFESAGNIARSTPEGASGVASYIKETTEGLLKSAWDYVVPDAGAATLEENGIQTQSLQANAQTVSAAKPPGKPKPKPRRVARNRNQPDQPDINGEMEDEMVDPMDVAFDEEDVMGQLEEEARGRKFLSRVHASLGMRAQAHNFAPVDAPEDENGAAVQSASTEGSQGEVAASSTSSAAAAEAIPSGEQETQRVGNAVQEGMVLLDGESVKDATSAPGAVENPAQSFGGGGFSEFVANAVSADPDSIPNLGLSKVTTRDSLASAPSDASAVASASEETPSFALASTAEPIANMGALLASAENTEAGEGDAGLSSLSSGIHFGSTWSFGEQPSRPSGNVNLKFKPKVAADVSSEETWSPNAENANEYFGAPPTSREPTFTPLNEFIEVSEGSSPSSSRAPEIKTTDVRTSTR